MFIYRYTDIHLPVSDHKPLLLPLLLSLSRSNPCTMHTTTVISRQIVDRITILDTTVIYPVNPFSAHTNQILSCYVASGSAAAQFRAFPGGRKASDDFDCPEDFGYYAHPTDCSKYYVCVFGGALEELCTAGLVYRWAQPNGKHE